MDWTPYKLYITFIFAVKISFAILAVIHYYLIHNSEDDTEFAREIIYWKERAGFIFTSSMAILTIMLFLPFNSKPIVIGNEARFLFLVFGIITLINSNWGLFIHQAKWFDEVQFILGETRFGKR
jgi:hypothetical protein